LLVWALWPPDGSAAARDRLGLTWSEISARAGGAKGAVQLHSGEILATRTSWSSNAVSAVCSRSVDGGTNWHDLSVIATGAKRDDLGDGHLIQLPAGPVLYSYRHNQHRARASGPRHYSIRTAISHDAGRTWQAHAMVAESSCDPAKEPDALRGLWSSFLLLKRDGTLQCYYDDEDTPHREGLLRHQWLTMRTWDTNLLAWVHPITVSRAHDRRDLSRDGMASVVELPSGRLLCVLESVQTSPPHANCIRLVTSDDGGQTWSWRREERRILFQSNHPGYLAVSPWVARRGDGQLLCAFATDEDRPAPGKPGTHAMFLSLDLKYLSSSDNGRTWPRAAQTIFAVTHHTYAPGILSLRDGSVLVTCQDFATSSHRAFSGRIVP
jgi:hypothetical protein